MFSEKIFTDKKINLWLLLNSAQKKPATHIKAIEVQEKKTFIQLEAQMTTIVEITSSRINYLAL